MCFLNERCESHQSPRNFVDSSTGRSVFPILTMGGLWARDRGAVKCMTLHLWAANLKPFLIAHSCMEFTACCRCLSMVSRERPRKQIARSSTKSALKMSLAIQEGSSLCYNSDVMQDNLFTLTFQHAWQKTAPLSADALAGGSCQTEGHWASGGPSSGCYHLLQCRRQQHTGSWHCLPSQGTAEYRHGSDISVHVRDGERDREGAGKGRCYQVHF